MSRPWLLVDRDDTILDDPGYLSDPEAIRFLPGAVEGLARFAEAGWPIVVITNQSGIGRGYFSREKLEAVHARFRALLRERGVELRGLYLCPHLPADGCACRKPAVGLAEQAAAEHGLELACSVMVGDKPSDLELGRKIGSGYVAQIVAKAKPDPAADGHFRSLQELAESLLDRLSFGGLLDDIESPLNGGDRK